MYFMRTILAPAMIVLIVVANATVWARGNGNHGHKSGHHRSYIRPPLYPYGYSPAPVYSNRYRPTCAQTPELETCARAREQVFPQSSNAAG